MNPEDVKVGKENKMTLAEAITKFSIEVLQLDETKNSPEMVAAITAVGSAGQFEADCNSPEAAQVKAASAKLSLLLGYDASTVR